MKKKILKGTIILTIAGLISRCIGFMYKIFLAGAMSTETIGLYQLVFPVFNVCYTLFASGIQVSVSKITAEIRDNNIKKTQLLKTACITSLSIATLLTIFVSSNSLFVARVFVKEEAVASGIKILSYSFPFCALTSVINGYFYGIKKSNIPAVSQLVEQVIRVGLVFLVAGIYSSDGSVSCELAVVGLLTGEVASCLFNIISFVTEKNQFSNFCASYSGNMNRKFAHMCIPLTLNRFVLSLLHSFETIILPILLEKSGYSHAHALTTLGILNGMTIPFLVFPSAITSSVSILLLPTISEAKCKGKMKTCRQATALVLKYSLLLGYICLGIFLLCGIRLCTLIFGNETAGRYLVILAFLCPLMYMSATVPSILNGLGKPLITFRNSCVINIVQITLLAVFILNFGIKGYFITMFITQFIQLYLDIYSLTREKMFKIDVKNAVIIPGLLVALLIPVFSLILKKISGMLGTVSGICMTAPAFIIFYILLLITVKAIKKSDFA
ncbi:MAG: oligosaccharide flippase family protein [Lachnospiraceae bacterium]